MTQLLLNLIDQLMKDRYSEYEKIDQYRLEENKDLILIISGKIMELDRIILYLKEMMEFNSSLKSNAE